MSIHFYETELEDFQDRFFATVEIEFEYSPGEPMVWYYPDGSGYPGSPPELNIIGVKVTSLSGGGWDKNRQELEESGWADFVDKLGLDEVSSLLDDGGIGDWFADHLREAATEPA